MNTLLVTVDSLRYDHYQYMIHTQDFLGESHDRTFATATATLGCFPTIFTGRTNEPHDIDPTDSFVNEINDFTIGITANQLVSERYGYGGGFDHFTSPITEGGISMKDKIAERIPRGITYDIATRVWSTFERALSIVSDPDPPFRPADEMINEFLENCGDTYFGWLHFMEPHHPYSPRSETGTRARRLSRSAVAGENPDRPEEVRRLYRQEVEELDESLHRLWQSIPSDTQVIFTADHGELLGEYGRWGHPGFLVPELLQVPFATRNIDISSEVVSLLDIPSYILGTEFKDGQFDREVAYASIQDSKAAINRGHIVSTEGSYALGEETEVDSALKRELARFRPSGVSKTDAVEEDLEALGYLE
ncbi:sulfatase-like hydrolase/transferase [Halapricum desulfuricans]|uniref:Arylsulfatase A or related enzyme n=1 Tax=Halapricum desulfuricans TaxID=2841257 RepID=A0A897NQC3_9EURY|nr:sulfatase-like hydrolase/transferase [Halapricum desulfuricans]QSG14968.1 Arylsulfatase A or related enzyme [Halapricum desulfuricans]